MFCEEKLRLNQYLANYKSSGNGDDNRSENPICIKGTAYNNDNNKAF